MIFTKIADETTHLTITKNANAVSLFTKLLPIKIQYV